MFFPTGAVVRQGNSCIGCAAINANILCVIIRATQSAVIQSASVSIKGIVQQKKAHLRASPIVPFFLTIAGQVADKNVLGPPGKVGSLGQHGLLHGLHAADDDGRFQSDKQTVDVSVALSQLRERVLFLKISKKCKSISNSQ